MTGGVKKSALAIAIAGLTLAVAAIVWLGAGRIYHAVTRIGWAGFGIVLAWQLLIYVLLGLAWRIVCPGSGWGTLIFGRLVREGGENCLPFSEIGGLLFGARAIALAGVEWSLAAASSVVDVIAEAVALVPFILFGLLVVLARGAGGGLVLPVAAGLALIAGGTAVGFLIRRRIAKLFRWAARKAAQGFLQDAESREQALEDTTGSLFGQRRRLAAASTLHLACWVGGGITDWLMYHFLGGHISVLNAVALDGLLSGALGIGFLVPGGIGVQEVSYIGLGQLFGVPASISLALSLVRRARDIVIGAPAILAWQGLEARRLRG